MTSGIGDNHPERGAEIKKIAEAVWILNRASRIARYPITEHSAPEYEPADAPYRRNVIDSLSDMSPEIALYGGNAWLIVVFDVASSTWRNCRASRISAGFAR